MSGNHSQEYIQGASASINKTIKDIEQLLQGAPLNQDGKMRARLRSILERSLIIQGRRWYKKGVNRGHKLAASSFSQNGIIPQKLKGTVKRKLLPGSCVKIKYKSVLKKYNRINKK